MPLPILLAIPATTWLIGGAVVVGGIAVAITADWLIDGVKGKKIVVLGGRGVGKTTLLKYLINGEITGNYEQTIGKHKIDKPFSLEKLGWIIKNKNIRATDVGGSEDHYAEWKVLAKDTDFIIYLFNVKDWLNNPEKFEPKFYNEINVIKDIIAENKNIEVMGVGTHIDLDENYSLSHFSQYRNKILGEPIMLGMLGLLGGEKRCKLELETLKDKVGLEKITIKILDYMFK